MRLSYDRVMEHINAVPRLYYLLMVDYAA